MTAPAPSGGPSPLRVGGIALLGVAIVAAIIGLATLATNGSPQANPTAAPPVVPSSPAAPDATPPGALPTVDGGVPVPSFAPPAEGTGVPAPAPGEAPAPGVPGAPAAPAPGPGDGGSGTSDRLASGSGATAARAPLRVYNNSRIEGLAARAAEDFGQAGWVVTDISAYGDGIIPITTVYYRPGTEEEAPARALATQFGLRAEARFDGINDASPGIIVIVTREYGTR
ncbi:hypothetical protein GCM10009609_58270 [Pseudonocardia aurantiaca]|uniref:LytR C-terminal domain-containing protein n=1 Tax=Pseudonocardia aurantiaca TaxID=75290 RepID=A0ABW4FS43_9PSEU